MPPLPTRNEAGAVPNEDYLHDQQEREWAVMMAEAGEGAIIIHDPINKQDGISGVSTGKAGNAQAYRVCGKGE